MSCVIQRLMIFSLGLTIHFFNPWAMVFSFVELVKEVRKEILTHWMNVGWIWTRMPGDFTLGQHCSLLYYFISHGKKKYIVFTCHTEKQLSCQPAKKSEKRREERKRKVKVKTAVSLLNPKTMSKFCFLRTPELRKLIFCIWIRRPPSVRPVNRFVVSFSSL